MNNFKYIYQKTRKIEKNKARIKLKELEKETIENIQK